MPAASGVKLRPSSKATIGVAAAPLPSSPLSRAADAAEIAELADRIASIVAGKPPPGAAKPGRGPSELLPGELFLSDMVATRDSAALAKAVSSCAV